MANDLVRKTDKAVADDLPGWAPSNVKATAFNSGDWVNSSAPGNVYSSGGYRYDYSPGTSINYATLAGAYWENSACQAVLNWLIRAWPESYPCVKRYGEGGKKLVVDN